ncbi:DUF1492 domain-containing protein [uncultured Helicobacter sp.]|uniref:DUF1492 domain-containing protein n=1 Tax=uncultured Helicobacter sp. TaxID=175537 RepID=UPI002622E80C|nr:DUF1492 domain-containing protein [uncultured Helicobacter sp.]
MNYFKAAEELLSSIPQLKSAKANLEKREKRLQNSGAPQLPAAISYDKPFTDSHFVSDTLNDLLELAECSRNLAETKQKLEEMENIIDQLKDEHKQLVNLWYVKSYSKESIMEAMNISSPTTIYNLRNKAVAEFALLYYGASALSSI